MQKREWTKRLGVSVIALLVGCVCFAANAAAEKPYAGQSITVTCWTSGFAEKLEPVIAGFEERTGATVQILPAWGGFFAKIKVSPKDQPPWDVIMCDPMEYSVLRNAEFLLPIREENVPNVEKIFPAVRDMSYMDGYGVIVGGEGTIPMYQPEVMDFTPTSWKDFLRPELKGEVTYSKSYWVETLYQAAFMMDDEPGAKEIYSDLDGVYQKAAELARHSKVAYSSGDQIRSMIKEGELAMGPYYSATVASGKKEGLYDGYLPVEGFTGYVAILGVVRGTQHRDLAEAWINEFLTKEAQIAEIESGGGCPVIELDEPAWIFEEGFQELMLTSNEAWANLFIPDYPYFREDWEKLESRYKKEVVSQTGRN